MDSPKIVFWLPEPLWPSSWPQNEEDNWPGFGLGVYAWTLQTWLRLTAAGFRCTLSQTVPDQGIVLFHSNSTRLVKAFPKPNSQQLFICLKAEAPPHPHAQLQVVQNPTEAESQQFFIPHWPQPGLLPRVKSRADRFETVAFFGHQNNLAPELQSPEWRRHLQHLGLCWRPIMSNNRWNDDTTLNNHWHDYREVDAVVAIRSFDSRVYRQTRQFSNKPPTKLYNAWLAGVPALLGTESAFRAVRQTSLDYLEVSTPTALIDQLIRLRDQPNLRRAIIAQGQKRSQSCSPEVITQQWVKFLDTVAIPAYDRWCQRNRLQQQWIKIQRRSTHYYCRFNRRFRAFL